MSIHGVSLEKIDKLIAELGRRHHGRNGPPHRLTPSAQYVSPRPLVCVLDPLLSCIAFSKVCYYFRIAWSGLGTNSEKVQWWPLQGGPRTGRNQESSASPLPTKESATLWVILFPIDRVVILNRKNRRKIEAPPKNPSARERGIESHFSTDESPCPPRLHPHRLRCGCQRYIR